jgi:hypothetical protein
MKQPNEEAFKAYKKAESEALRIMEQMRKTGAKTVDIELALLVAVFELHKKSLPAGTISNIVKGHLDTLEQYYRPADFPQN